MSNMTSDEIDDKCKVIIGNLLQCPCPLSKTVITAFDFKASRAANTAFLNSSKFKIESLEACAEFLNITLADTDSNKLFTKATLAPRLVDALFALLPSICMECNDHYTVDHEPVSDPFFTCYRCFQGSHSCDQMKAQHTALADIALPTGMVWLCKRCHAATNPVAPRKSKSRHNSVSKIDSALSRLTNESNSQSIPSPLSTENTETPKHGGLESEDSRNHLRRKLSEHIDNSPASTTICKKYKVGQCPHGLRGNKLVNNLACPHNHPKRCFKYCKFGTDKKKGCNKGNKCLYFHPVLCKFSTKDKKCSKEDCPYPHLVGTKRTKGTEKGPKVREKPKGPRLESASARTPTEVPGNSTSNTPDQDHFLVLQKMVENMGKQFQQELQTIKSNIYHLQHPHMANAHPATVSNPLQQLPSPMHQVFPTAWSTPRYSC